MRSWVRIPANPIFWKSFRHEKAIFSITGCKQNICPVYTVVRVTSVILFAPCTWEFFLGISALWVQKQCWASSVFLQLLLWLIIAHFSEGEVFSSASSFELKSSFWKCVLWECWDKIQMEKQKGKWQFSKTLMKTFLWW